MSEFVVGVLFPVLNKLKTQYWPLVHEEWPFTDAVKCLLTSSCLFQAPVTRIFFPCCFFHFLVRGFSRWDFFAFHFIWIVELLFFFSFLPPLPLTWNFKIAMNSWINTIGILVLDGGWSWGENIPGTIVCIITTLKIDLLISVWNLWHLEM